MSEFTDLDRMMHWEAMLIDNAGLRAEKGESVASGRTCFCNGGIHLYDLLQPPYGYALL